MPVSTRAKIAGGATGAVIAAAVAFIGPMEGLKLIASHNSFDPPGVIDVCYGNTKHADLPDLKPGDKFTKEQCNKLFAEKLQEYDACLVKELKPDVYKALPLQRHVALISFVYNLGCGKLTARPKDSDGNPVGMSIAQALNVGNVAYACGRFKQYVYANHVVLRGLVKRREAEYERCMGGE